MLYAIVTAIALTAAPASDANTLNGVWRGTYAFNRNFSIGDAADCHQDGRTVTIEIANGRLVGNDRSSALEGIGDGSFILKSHKVREMPQGVFISDILFTFQRQGDALYVQLGNDMLTRLQTGEQAQTRCMYDMSAKRVVSHKK